MSNTNIPLKFIALVAVIAAAGIFAPSNTGAIEIGLFAFVVFIISLSEKMKNEYTLAILAMGCILIWVFNLPPAIYQDFIVGGILISILTALATFLIYHWHTKPRERIRRLKQLSDNLDRKITDNDHAGADRIAEKLSDLLEDELPPGVARVRIVKHEGQPGGGNG